MSRWWSQLYYGRSKQLTRYCIGRDRIPRKCLHHIGCAILWGGSSRTIGGNLASERHLNDDLARMEANVFTFKETVESDLKYLMETVSNQEKKLGKHVEELRKLREENVNFKSLN